MMMMSYDDKNNHIYFNDQYSLWVFRQKS